MFSLSCWCLTILHMSHYPANIPTILLISGLSCFYPTILLIFDYPADVSLSCWCPANVPTILLISSLSCWYPTIPLMPPLTCRRRVHVSSLAGACAMPTQVSAGPSFDRCGEPSRIRFLIFFLNYLYGLSNVVFSRGNYVLDSVVLYTFFKSGSAGSDWAPKPWPKHLSITCDLETCGNPCRLPCEFDSSGVSL